MSTNNESMGKTLGVVVGLCLVCAIVVSFASVQLRPMQQANKNEDIQRNILAVAGFDKVKNVSEIFNQNIESRVVSLKTGEFVEDVKAESFDFEATKFDAKRSYKLSKEEDKAGIQRITNNSPVYFAKDDQGKVSTIILPIQGYGLWGVMYGFLALEADGETIKSINFYKHSETPGLGGEIQNPKWTALWDGKALPIDVVKGSAGGNEHKVDGLSGATLTSNGVDHTVDFWTSDKAFGPFLAKVRKGALN
ncbi:Na(+)-translocating NADH-quinone reductase subunit C [Pseudoalteromonas piscicida]|uniref:Na(+)-translocating NADH-quinone reductase subunit C n=1 Tax=Pseudoalteromonas piscicida TaxID=43662 RepID=A0A2A5JRI5_PSEO7|nr:Na(+)-translocating NADH-quinone reductase subunit C [Pseudoalteromonas piscicida]PCK32016.1 Na(+)-translocating NADH-quinone reductase subunit C [Pseudoalteromonas piscicida]